MIKFFMKTFIKKKKKFFMKTNRIWNLFFQKIFPVPFAWFENSVLKKKQKQWLASQLSFIV